jgi:hypothetical protein
VNDAALFEALDDLVPADRGAFGDWDEVLARASISVRASPVRARPATLPRRRLVTRRRLLAVALVVAALVALFATPAFGIRQLLLDIVGRKNVPFSKSASAPYEVKREFFDLSLGAPPRMAPGAIASEARRVATFRSGGRTHVLYVAPTRRGGYCMTFSGGFGGCRTTRSGPLLGLTWTGSVFHFPRRPHEPPEHSTQVGGEILAANARSVRVEYEDGSSTPIPFVYVSKPIDAAFFLYGIPKGHERPGTRVHAVSVLDGRGGVLARQLITYAEPRPVTRPPFKPSKQPIRRSPRLPPPSSPLQEGDDGGVSVRAGRNGVAVFDTTGATPKVRNLIRGRALGYACFSYMAYHEDAPAELGTTRTTFPRVAIRPFGIPTPFDGCEIQGSYGHVWPDRNGSHSAVEIAFDARASRFFADRAAARDLALFVRSRTVQRLRKLPPAAAATAIARRYPDSGRIHYAAKGDRLVFAERSPTGRRYVVVVRGGRIVRENVKPLAFVF